MPTLAAKIGRLGKGAQWAMVLSCTGTSMVSAGETGPYAGLGYSAQRYIEDKVPDHFNVATLVGKAGYRSARFFALEGRYAFASTPTTKTLSGLGLDYTVSLDSLYGVYGKAYVPLGTGVWFHGLLGVSWAELTTTATVPGFGSADVPNEASDWSYGAGLHLQANPWMALDLDYVSYLTESRFDLGGLEFTVSFIY